MSLANSIKVRFEAVRELAFGSISGSYAIVGTPFTKPVRLLKVTTLSNGDLMISYDGVTDHDVVASGGFYLYDYGSNRSNTAGNAEQSVGEAVFVKTIGAAPTSGSVYVTLMYLSNV